MKKFLALAFLFALPAQAASTRILDQTANTYNSLREIYNKRGPIGFQNYFSVHLDSQFAKEVPQLFKGLPKIPKAVVRDGKIFVGENLWIAPAKDKSGDILINGKTYHFQPSKGVSTLQAEIKALLESKRGAQILWDWMLPSAQAKTNWGTVAGAGAIGGAAGAAIALLLIAIFQTKKTPPVKRGFQGDVGPLGPHGPASTPAAEEPDNSKKESEEKKEAEAKKEVEVSKAKPIDFNELQLRNFFCEGGATTGFVVRRQVEANAIQVFNKGSNDDYTKLWYHNLRERYLAAIKDQKNAKEGGDMERASIASIFSSINSELTEKLEKAETDESRKKIFELLSSLPAQLEVASVNPDLPTSEIRMGTSTITLKYVPGKKVEESSRPLEVKAIINGADVILCPKQGTDVAPAKSGPRAARSVSTGDGSGGVELYGAGEPERSVSDFVRNYGDLVTSGHLVTTGQEFRGKNSSVWDGFFR